MFYHICKAIEREQLATPDEPVVPISDADVYVKTRKRYNEREYKLPTAAIKEKIVSYILVIEYVSCTVLVC